MSCAPFCSAEKKGSFLFVQQWPFLTLQSESSHKLVFPLHSSPGTAPPPSITNLLWHFLCYRLTKQRLCGWRWGWGWGLIHPLLPQPCDFNDPPQGFAWHLFSLSLSLSSAFLDVIKKKELSHLIALDTLVHSSITTTSQSPSSAVPASHLLPLSRWEDKRLWRWECWLAWWRGWEGRLMAIDTFSGSDNG